MIKTNKLVSLTEHTWMKIKNTFAFDVLFPASLDELISVIEHFPGQFLILGNGSNTLLDSYEGVVIKTKDFNKIEFRDGYVVVEAGVLPRSLLSACMDRSLCGFEFMSTIPGTIGGMALMNAGAHGDCMGNHIRWVEILVLNTFGKYITTILDAKDINFSYRLTSIEGIITRVALNAKPVNPEESKKEINRMVDYINSTQPRYMTLGSTFKNQDIPAWKLIDSLDPSHLQTENAEFSPKHRNFLINKGDATAGELLGLIKIVQEGVYTKFGRKLELEILCINK